MRVAVILPYFGKFPNYFTLYLYSCSFNPKIDFLIFTDILYEDQYPDNVKFITLSFKELQETAQYKLGFRIELSNPYKLCDLRPAYGVVFADYIKGYDYWGYGDIDVIYGDLQMNLFAKVNNGFDIISFRKEILSGSLSFFKNTKYINNLYKLIVGFEKYVNDSRNFLLDEAMGSTVTWNGGSKTDLPHTCMTYITNQELISGRLKVHFETLVLEWLDINEYVKFKNGQLLYNENSIPYFHYVLYKNKMQFKKLKYSEIPSTFIISKYGYFTLVQWKYLSALIVQWRELSFLKKRVINKMNKLFKK